MATQLSSSRSKSEPQSEYLSETNTSIQNRILSSAVCKLKGALRFNPNKQLKNNKEKAETEEALVQMRQMKLHMNTFGEKQKSGRAGNQPVWPPARSAATERRPGPVYPSVSPLCFPMSQSIFILSLCSPGDLQRRSSLIPSAPSLWSHYKPHIYLMEPAASLPAWTAAGHWALACASRRRLRRGVRVRLCASIRPPTPTYPSVYEWERQET